MIEGKSTSLQNKWEREINSPLRGSRVARQSSTSLESARVSITSQRSEVCGREAEFTATPYQKKWKKRGAEHCHVLTVIINSNQSVFSLRFCTFSSIYIPILSNSNFLISTSTERYEHIKSNLYCDVLLVVLQNAVRYK